MAASRAAGGWVEHLFVLNAFPGSLEGEASFKGFEGCCTDESDDHKPDLLLAAEGTGDTFALITWVSFGAVVGGRR